MIASTSSGSSFGALGSYLEGGKGGEPDGAPSPDRVAWVESTGVVRDVDGAASVGRAARVMEATAELNPRCTSPCYHVSISFDPSDLPGGVSDPAARETMLSVAGQTLRDLGLAEHQAVVVAHGDRDHPHLHLMVNRVHPETGRAWDRWQDRVRIERSLRAQERARCLREVPGQLGRLEGQERPARGLSGGVYRSAERTAEVEGRRPLLEEARASVRWEVERAKGWEALEGALADHGYVLRAKGRGLVVRDGSGREVKASAVSRAGGRGRLEKRFGETWREHRAGVEARTGPVPGGLSPHAEAVVRAHRDLEAATQLHAGAVEAAKRVTAAERAVRDLAERERDVVAARTTFRHRLGAVYEDPAGAERLFLKLEGAEGTARATAEMARRPERFGALRREEHRTLGVVTKRTEAAARAAAVEAARAGERYVGTYREVAAEKDRAPRALREAEAAHGRAVARTKGRPRMHAAERRLEGLGKGLAPGDKRALGRLAPEAAKTVENVVAKALRRGLARGLDLGR